MNDNCSINYIKKNGLESYSKDIYSICDEGGFNYKVNDDIEFIYFKNCQFNNSFSFFFEEGTSVVFEDCTFNTILSFDRGDIEIINPHFFLEDASVCIKTEKVNNFSVFLDDNLSKKVKFSYYFDVKNKLHLAGHSTTTTFNLNTIFDNNTYVVGHVGEVLLDKFNCYVYMPHFVFDNFVINDSNINAKFPDVLYKLVLNNSTISLDKEIVIKDFVALNNSLISAKNYIKISDDLYNSCEDKVILDNDYCYNGINGSRRKLISILKGYSLYASDIIMDNLGEVGLEFDNEIAKYREMLKKLEEKKKTTVKRLSKKLNNMSIFEVVGR